MERVRSTILCLWMPIESHRAKNATRLHLQIVQETCEAISKSTKLDCKLSKMLGDEQLRWVSHEVDPLSLPMCVNWSGGFAEQSLTPSCSSSACLAHTQQFNEKMETGMLIHYICHICRHVMSERSQFLSTAFEREFPIGNSFSKPIRHLIGFWLCHLQLDSYTTPTRLTKLEILSSCKTSFQSHSW